jgi:hypothetical protein
MLNNTMVVDIGSLKTGIVVEHNGTIPCYCYGIYVKEV